MNALATEHSRDRIGFKRIGLTGTAQTQAACGKSFSSLYQDNKVKSQLVMIAFDHRAFLLGAHRFSPTDKNRSRPRLTKKDQLVRLLETKSGRSAKPLSLKLAWQPHTARTAMSGLRNAGNQIDQIAKSGQTSKRRTQQMINLAFLAPDNVRDVLDGTQPVGFAKNWCKQHTLPDDWNDQRALVKPL